jgi:hypothetical protein
LEETGPCGNAERNPCHERSSGENPNGNTRQINMAGLFQIEYVIFYTKHGSKHAGNGRASLTIQCSPPQSGRTPTKEVGAGRGLGNRQRTCIVAPCCANGRYVDVCLESPHILLPCQETIGAAAENPQTARYCQDSTSIQVGMGFVAKQCHVKEARYKLNFRLAVSADPFGGAFGCGFWVRPWRCSLISRWFWNKYTSRRAYGTAALRIPDSAVE